MLPFGLIACSGDGVPETAEPGDEFCELAEEAKESGDDLDDVDFTDADELEDAFAEALESAEAAAAKAPKDITEDINERLELQREVVATLDDADYDITEAFADPDFLELAEELDELGEEVDEYLEDNCDIEIEDEEEEEDVPVDTADSAISIPIDTDELSEALITRENFLDFYAIGAGVEITQEMKDCFTAEISDLSDDEFAGAVDGSSEAGTFTIGAAVLTCGIPIET